MFTRRYFESNRSHHRQAACSQRTGHEARKCRPGSFLYHIRSLRSFSHWLARTPTFPPPPLACISVPKSNPRVRHFRKKTLAALNAHTHKKNSEHLLVSQITFFYVVCGRVRTSCLTRFETREHGLEGALAVARAGAALLRCSPTKGKGG